MAKKVSYKQIVGDCLKTNFNLRDSDPKLYSEVLHKLNVSVDNISAKSLIFMTESCFIPSYTTIVRIRQRFQQLNPELRGSSYLERNSYRKQNALRDLGYKS